MRVCTIHRSLIGLLVEFICKLVVVGWPDRLRLLLFTMRGDVSSLHLTLSVLTHGLVALQRNEIELFCAMLSTITLCLAPCAFHARNLLIIHSVTRSNERK